MLTAWGARAQDNEHACDVRADLVYALNTRQFGSNPLWTRPHGTNSKTEFYVSGVAQEDGTSVAAGEVLETGSETPLLLFTAFDVRGRPLWERPHRFEGLIAVRKILRQAGGYVVLAERRKGQSRSAAWLGFFDAAGYLRGESWINMYGEDISPRDMIAAPDGRGFFLAATVNANGDTAEHAALYRVDANGKTLFHKTYQPGLGNAINALAAADNGRLLAGGYIRSEDGRRNGWVLSLNADGTIAWQRQHPRGRGAAFTSIARHTQGYAVAGGYSDPLDDEAHRAGWVLLFRQDMGETGWQRFYTGAAQYTVTGLLSETQSLLRVLLDAKAPKESVTPVFPRVLTLDPRGRILASDEYQSGEGTEALALAPAAGHGPMIFGATTVVYHRENAGQARLPPKTQNAANAKKEEKEKTAETQKEDDTAFHSRDGWVVALPQSDPYKDPCLRPPRRD